MCEIEYFNHDAMLKGEQSIIWEILVEVFNIVVTTRKKSNLLPEKFIYNVQYRIFTEFIFRKIKWFKVFQNSNIFYFREFNADQKCSGCLFSILSIFWVIKILTIKIILNFLLNLSLNLKLYRVINTHILYPTFTKGDPF